MSTRFILTPESAHFPSAGAAALKKDPAGRMVLAFDAAAIETVYWAGITPQNFSGTPNVTVVVNYYMPNASGATNNVVWDVAIEAPAVSSESVGSASFFDVNTTQVSTIPTTANTFKQQSIVVTNTDGLTASGYFRLKLARNATATFDTASNDAHVLAVEFRDAV